MHQLRSKLTITRFRLVATLLALKVLLIPAVIGLLFYAYTTSNHGLIKLALGLAGLTAVIGVLVWSLASSARCPLCMMPVMGNLKCSPHRRARPLLGSHRNRVAFAILSKGWFTCPYCHEQTAMQVRKSNLLKKPLHPHD